MPTTTISSTPDACRVYCPECDTHRSVTPATFVRYGAVKRCRACADTARRGNPHGYNVGRKRQLPDKECPTCHNTFRPGSAKAKFCSLKCRPAPAHKNQIEKHCIKCGVAFSVPQCRASAQYCSSYCTRNRTRFECLTCGTPFERPASSVAVKNGSGYCSPECVGIGKRKERRKPDTNSPYVDSKGGAPEHRLVMAQHLGRRLLPDETVHHINGNRAHLLATP